MADVTFYAYVSTGKLSAMFTLWTGREHVNLMPGVWLRDRYVCNLAAADNEEEALRKALDYCERMSDRIGQPVRFDGFYDEPQNLRRGKLSVRDTISLERIEQGLFPFGKHAGTKITDAPDGYVMFWADKHSDPDMVAAALAAACMGVAMDRDLITKRDAARAERAALDAQSEFVGTIGERREFVGEVVTAFDKRDQDCIFFTITKIRTADGALITYIGNRIAEKGETIRVKATVKRHDTYQGVKSTVVSRPHRIKEKAA